MSRLDIIFFIMGVLGSGLMAGLFCSFSNFIMKSLAKIPPTNGIAAMQSINIVIVRPTFLFVFFGTGVFSLLALMLGWQELNVQACTFGSLGFAVYLLGCLGVTLAFNVPLNNRLAMVDPSSHEGEKMWQLYLVSWVRWNHVRSLSTIVSTLFLVLAVFYSA